jgi:hypothetical protein
MNTARAASIRRLWAVLRAEITPRGAGSTMQVACFALKRDGGLDLRRFAIEVVAALPFLAAAAAILRVEDGWWGLGPLLPAAVFTRDAQRKRKAERAANGRSS